MGAFLNWLTGTDAEIERGQALDAQMRELNAQRPDGGAFLESYDRNNYGSENYGPDLEAGFNEGWQEGVDNLTAPLKSIVNGVKTTVTIYGLLQLAALALVLYVVYKFFKGGGSVRQFIP